MRKIIHCFPVAALLLLLLTAPNLSAQPASWRGYITSSPPTTDDTSLVRTLDGRTLVSKFTYSGTRYFAYIYTDGFMIDTTVSMYGFSIFKIPIPVDCEVRDFRVVGNTVFFCGVYHGGYAMYGWMNIPTNMVSTPSTYHVYFTSAATTLDRLAVYDTAHMVAVGTAQGGTCGCIAEVKNLYADPTAILAYMPSGMYADDVVLTDEHVAVLQRHTPDPVAAAGLRFGPRSSVMASGTIDHLYCLPAQAGLMLGKMRGTATGHESLAMGYVCSPKDLNVCEVDLTLLPSLQPIVVQTGDMHQPGTLDEMAYLRPVDTLVSLYNGVVEEITHFGMHPTVNYTAPGHTSLDRRYMSVTDMGGIAYAAWGCMGLFLQKAYTMSTAYTCLGPYPREVSVSPQVPSHWYLELTKVSEVPKGFVATKNWETGESHDECIIYH